MNKKSSIAARLGETLAVIQHVTDLAWDFGFKKLKKISGQPPPVVTTPALKTNNVRRYMALAGYYTRKTLSFLGDAGKSYYESYEELKRRKSKIR